jgi:hypothetical protein
VTAPQTAPRLPALPLAEWEPTKQTLHLWLEIVGKVRMASRSTRNHWWHAALYADIRGLTTQPLYASDGTGFRIDFDFVDHRLVVSTGERGVEPLELVDGLSVAQFDERLHRALAELGVDVAIREIPFGVPVKTPFSDDRAHAAYDREAVGFHRVLAWSTWVLEEFSGWCCGKTSPVASLLALVRSCPDAGRR